VQERRTRDMIRADDMVRAIAMPRTRGSYALSEYADMRWRERAKLNENPRGVRNSAYGNGVKIRYARRNACQQHNEAATA